jgi:hypothetical protein
MNWVKMNLRSMQALGPQAPDVSFYGAVLEKVSPLRQDGVTIIYIGFIFFDLLSNCCDFP